MEHFEIVFPGDHKPYLETQPIGVRPGGKVFDRRYRIGVQNNTGRSTSAVRVVLEDCEPHAHHGIHLEHALSVMGRPGANQISVVPGDTPLALFDVIYDEMLEDKLLGDGFGLCYAAPVSSFAIPRGSYTLTLRVDARSRSSQSNPTPFFPF